MFFVIAQFPLLLRMKTHINAYKNCTAWYTTRVAGWQVQTLFNLITTCSTV